MKRIGWAIAISALLITIPRYYTVLHRIDQSWAPALGMGILLAGGAAYIFHTWATTKRQNSWRLLAAFAVNLAYEPFLITPFVLSRLWGQDLAEVMSWQFAIVWAILIATAPILLVAGAVLAVAFQKETGKKAESSGKVAEGPEKVAGAFGKVAARSTFSAFLSGNPDLANMGVPEISESAGVTERTARNWKRKARET